MSKRFTALAAVIWLVGCVPQSVTERAADTPSRLQQGCQFEVLDQSAAVAGQYRQVAFTYLGEGQEVPKRFTADVLTFPAGALGAELLDQPDLEQYETVPQAAQRRGAIAAINGGYYGEEFEPIGLYVLNGQERQALSNASDLLTGVLSINATGHIDLSTRAEFTPGNAVSAFQAGPFLIDPGNVLGIYSDNGKLRKRTVVATSDRQDTVVLTTSPTSLYTLAQCLHTQPTAVNVSILERALNLDGGVSTGMYIQLTDADLSKPEELSVRNTLLLYDLD